MARNVLFLQASARPEGNSLALARLAAGGLPAGSVTVWRDLGGAGLPRFEDHRHDGGYGPLSPQSEELAREALAATDMVFVAPLYWYGLPAAAKLYLDHWSHWLRVPALDFKAGMRGKRMWLIMAHSGSSPAEIAPALDGLKFSADYMGMVWGGAVLSDSNAPGQWQKDAGAIAAAKALFAG